MEQDLYEAKIHASFEKGKNKVYAVSYVSADEDVMIIKLSLSGTKAIQGHVNLSLPGRIGTCG